MTLPAAISTAAFLAAIFFWVTGLLLEETNAHRLSEVAFGMAIASLITSLGAILTSLGIAIITT